MLTHPEKFTKVTGTIRQMQPDLTTDPDDKPGTVGITADLLFTPLVGTGDLFHLPMLPSPTDPETFAPELRAPKPIPAKLVDGVLKDATGNPYIQLWAADMFTVPSELRYEVSFKNVQADGKQIPNITPFAFVAVPDTTIDLSAVARVPNSPGPMARGEQGIGIENITELEGVLTFDMNDGSTYDISLPGFTSALTETRAARDAALAAQGVAEGAAGDAVTSASQAETANTNAQGARSDAITAKDAAESARGTAVTAKDDAVTAKNAAESARGTAVTAKDDAVTAKNAAESARGTAVTAKDDAVTAKNAAESARGTAVTAKDDAVTAKNAAETAQAAAEQALADANAMIIPTASVTKPKLSADLQASIDKADNAVQPAALSGYAPLVGGIIPQSYYGPIALTDFLGAVSTQSAMLALVGQRGDWCTRTDRGTDFQLIAEPSSSLASWRERTYPASPVSSVHGRTGVITTQAADITDSTAVGRSVLVATDAGAARSAIAAVASTDTRLSDARTPTVGTSPYDISFSAQGGTRTIGYGDVPAGIKLNRGVTFSRILAHVDTSDASGSTTVHLYKNNASVASVTMAAGTGQTVGTSASGTWTFAEGDMLAIYVSAVGTTPGRGLMVELKGLA